MNVFNKGKHVDSGNAFNFSAQKLIPHVFTRILLICFTMLQTGRLWVWFPTVSLEFFSDIILVVALWPWVRLSLYQKWVPVVFPGGKGGRCIRLTTLPPSCAVVMKSGNLNFLEPSGPLQACNRTALPFNFYYWSICMYIQKYWHLP